MIRFSSQQQHYHSQESLVPFLAWILTDSLNEHSIFIKLSLHMLIPLSGRSFPPPFSQFFWKFLHGLPYLNNNNDTSKHLYSTSVYLAVEGGEVGIFPSDEGNKGLHCL